MKIISHNTTCINNNFESSFFASLEDNSFVRYGDHNLHRVAAILVSTVYYLLI